MKLKDFDFRIVKPKNEQGGYNSCSNDECVCNTPFLYGDEARYRLGEFIDNGEGGIELWSGFCDRNDKRIYEGDILAHDNGYGIEYHSKVVFENGAFKLAIIEHPAVEIMEGLRTEFLKVIGNIHENEKLLNGS